MPYDDPLILRIPERSLVLLVGPSGSGKSTFAQRHFQPTEIVSSDACRALVCDDEADQSANAPAFFLLHSLVRLRLQRGRLTVVDATNVQFHARRPLRAIARRRQVPIIAIVFNLPPSVATAWNRARPGRQVPDDVLEQQRMDLQRTRRALPREHYHAIYQLSEPAQIDRTQVIRGPFTET